MTNQERFSQEHGVPMYDVQSIVDIANRIGDAETHACNGDPHPQNEERPQDKNLNSQFWSKEADSHREDLWDIVWKYGFTGIAHCGLGPTLKKKEQFVDIPY
jgi:hypothetical protein